MKQKPDYSHGHYCKDWYFEKSKTHLDIIYIVHYKTGHRLSVVEMEAELFENIVSSELGEKLVNQMLDKILGGEAKGFNLNIVFGK